MISRQRDVLMSYSWDAVRYSRLDLPHMRWGDELLSKLETKGDETILEIGCGTGRDTEKLAQLVPSGRVVAVDQSESMLKVARSALVRRYPNIEFRHSNVMNDLEISGSCDAAFSVATLHWVDDHALAFSNISTALKPGAVFLGDCGGKGNIESITEVVRAILGPSEADSLFHFEDIAVTEVRLKAAGFDVRDIELLPDPAKFDSTEAFKSFIATIILGAHLSKIDSEEREDFLSEIAARLPDLSVDYVRLRIDAVKN